MALFKIDTEKQYLTEFWSNRYFVDAETLLLAQGLGNQIANAEILCHYDHVKLTKFRVSSATPGDDVYVIVPININGALAGLSQRPLPLFNCARVDFAVATGRPSRKYLRTGVTEGGIDGNIFTGDQLSALNTYATTMASLDGFVDADGQGIIFGVVFPDIAMRQLRRGTRQKTQPILP